MKFVIFFISILVGFLLNYSQGLPKNSPNPWKDDYTSVSKMDCWKKWGPYNVHDPSCKKIGEYYYIFSTDAIYHPTREEAERKDVATGYIPIRRSKDLINWELLGWVFDSIPREGRDWVKNNNNGHGGENIWAPYIVESGNGKYRLYYCVSAFGKKTSFIGLAESKSPEGPWRHIGEVVKSNKESKMNAIDPTVIKDEEGKEWMIYGSFFGGLYCVELDPETGLPLKKGDQGHLIARRANWVKDNLEAPEIIRHEPSGNYFLFYSYDPLMTTYNVRVARSKKADGPFFDFFGKNIADTTNNYPVLTAPYKFENHPGWVGAAHCGVFEDERGNYFMAHQGRYAQNPGLMDLHIRQIFFTSEGWPVVSPERFAGVKERHFKEKNLEGNWEVIRVKEPRVERNLEASQILLGEGYLNKGEWNVSQHLNIRKESGLFVFDEETQLLSLNLEGEWINDLIVHAGHDWERETETILFTGLDAHGHSVWGKLVNAGK